MKIAREKKWHFARGYSPQIQVLFENFKKKNFSVGLLLLDYLGIVFELFGATD